MKSKLTIFIAMLILSGWSLSGNAQISPSKDLAKLTMFSNTNAKFTVPSGKTWTLHGVLASFPADDNTYSVYVKSINDVILTDLSKNMFGKLLYSTNNLANLNFPLVFPENTVFELIISKRVGETRSLYDKSALLNYTEN
jgi:hypothetical protein